jgi:dephospho-CoA kinase
VVHELLGEPGLSELLRERWGEEVAPAGGVPDRVRIAHIVFERPEELAWLESQLHPLVGQRIRAWAAALAPGMLGVAEVPLLFESAMEDAFDAVVCVISDEQTRRARADARGQAALAAREARQLSQEEKAARADYVVENDGTVEELEARIAALLPRLVAE